MNDQKPQNTYRKTCNEKSILPVDSVAKIMTFMIWQLLFVHFLDHDNLWLTLLSESKDNYHSAIYTTYLIILGSVAAKMRMIWKRIYKRNYKYFISKRKFCFILDFLLSLCFYDYNSHSNIQKYLKILQHTNKMISNKLKCVLVL